MARQTKARSAPCPLICDRNLAAKKQTADIGIFK